MTINIKIENCESINEIYTHLKEIRREIKAEAKRLNVNGFDEFESRMQLEDNNCYGTHCVKIRP